jgi:myosin heavy subunit
MPSISTQTTTFLPAIVPVLQRRSLTKRFLARMMRKHFNDVKQTNTNRAKFQRNVTADKKALLKILKDMTLTIRKNKAETKKALKAANKAAKESAKEANMKAKEQKLFDTNVKIFSKELKKAAKLEFKADMKEQKKFDTAAKKFAADQKKIDQLSERALRNQAAQEVISNNTNDSVFIPFLGWVSA